MVRALGLFGSNGCQQFESDGKFRGGFVRGAGRWFIWLVFVFVAALVTVTLATVTTVATVTITIIFITEIVVEWNEGSTTKANDFEIKASQSLYPCLWTTLLWLLNQQIN